MKEKLDEAHVWTDQELSELEKRIAAEYKKAADELQDTIDGYFARFADRDAKQKELIGSIINGREYTEQDYRQWRLAQIGRGRQFEDLRDRVAERMTHANEVAAAYINDTTPGLYSLNRNYAAYTIERHAGVSVGFDLWDEQTVKRLIVEQPDLMPYYPPERAVNRGIDLAWGKRQITAQVTSGILQGESIKRLADRLQTNISNMNRDSAIRAARTAVTGAQNAGRQDSYVAADRMGIKLKKEWLATLDNRTRHAHALLDGQQAEIDKPFKVEGEEIMFPGDPSAAGWLVYNCRCTLIAAVDGVDTSDAKRRARDPVTGENGVIENMTYAEWAGWKETLKDASASGIIKPTISGVSCGERMTFLQADSGRVNPKYGTAPGYAINCQTCVPTFEARLRGYNVMAKPNTSGSPLQALARQTNLIWIDPVTGEHPQYIFDRTITTPKGYFRFISELVQPGQRYSIQFAWRGRGNSGHIVNLDRTEEGLLRIKDNQRGEGETSEWIGDRAVLSYLSQMKYITTLHGMKFPIVPKLLRLDTLEFDFDFASKVMEELK